MAIESNSQYLERLEKYLNKKKRNESFLVGKLKEWIKREEKALKYLSDDLVIGLLSKEFFHALDDSSSFLNNQKLSDKLAENTISMIEEFNKIRLL